MKFNNLSELIDFESNLSWVNEKDLVLEDYSIDKGIKSKMNKLKGTKVFGVYADRIVSVVSDKFKPISVSEIAAACDNVFGGNFVEKSFKEGIIRIYDKGIENRIGKVTPMVIYPANIGTMAVNIGIHHNAFVCSNGLIISDNFLTRRIIHRVQDVNLKGLIREVSGNLGLVANKISEANELMIDKGVQLAMIIQGLNLNYKLISKALSDYAPVNNSLWETIQSITYVARDEGRKGYQFAKNAGQLLINQSLTSAELVQAGSYAFINDFNNKGFLHADNLYLIASELMARGVNYVQ